MLDFARAGAAVGATSATLEKTRILGGYFRTLDEDDLKRAAVYMSGRAFPPSQRRTLGLGWSTLSKVVSSVSRRDEAELGEIFRKHSDLGDWAAEALDGSTQPAPVSLQDVEATLEAIRSARGNTKVAPLEAMVRLMDPESARFFIKIITGEMRIGLSEGLVEAAIAEAFGVPITQVKRVHLVTGDIGETAVRCKRGHFEASSITLFQPVRFMLASPVETPGEVFERMATGKVWTEEKYDGVRCQMHRQASRVELFSRDLISLRMEKLRQHYPWLAGGLDYFEARLTQAPEDAHFAINYVHENAKTPAEQVLAIQALRDKCDILWAQLDALYYAYVQPGWPPPGALQIEAAR